jgi:serine/threonine-protein kinase
MVLQANTIVRGKYRITRLIGDGGMGAVYEAEHLLLKVPVALKFLHTELAQRPGLAERFLREARVSASIQSPHVTRVTDVDTTDAGTPFLVMELLRGESLQDLLDRQHQLPQATCIDYTLQILSGLEAAHALDVVHRDLKPDNVFIVQSQGGPILKLIDFGIAKLRSSEEFKESLTRAGALMGTPEYMAPEQLYSAENVDARADLFSVGVMLYEMLCGERPASGDEAAAIVSQFVLGTIVPLRERLPDTPEALAMFVERALKAQRDERFDSAFSMRVALAPLATSLSHAGRLAATPAPLPIDGTRASATHDDDPSTRRTSVADTLPPDSTRPVKTADDPVVAEGGATEDAPLPELQAQARGHVSAMAPPASPLAQKAGAEFRLGTPAVPHTDVRPRGKGKVSALLVVLVVLLVMIASAMVAVILVERRPGYEPVRDVPLDATPPKTVDAGLEPRVPDAADTVSPSPPPDVPPQSGPRPAPGPAPTRPTPSATAPSNTPALPPFPSSFPPLPSSLPPLPSGFPTALPSFLPPIPGFTPPAQQQASDAGP